MFLFSQQFLSKTVLILKIQSDVIVNVHMPSCKVLFMLVKFLMKLEFFFNRFFSKNHQILNFMVMCLVGAEFHADGQT